MKTKKILFRSLIFILSIFITALHYSCQDPPTTENNDDNDTIPTTMPQEHIPWPSLADSPWPMYKHDPQGTGRSQYVGPQLGELAFTFNDTFWFEGSVAIGDSGILYLTSSGNEGSRLYAITPSANIVWKTVLKPDGFTETYSTPIISMDEIIYVSSSDQNYGKIHAILTDGTEYWMYELNDALYSNIILDIESNLYFITHNPKRLISLTHDGILRWALSVPGEFHNGVNPASFSPDGSTLYTGGGDSLYAITTTGEILWGYWTSALVRYSMVDNNGNIYFYNPGDSSITSLNPSGDINWQTNISTLNVRWIAYNTAPTIDKDGNIYFVGNVSGGINKLISLKGFDGELRWELVLVNGPITDLVSDVMSNLYFGASSTVYCVSSDGEILWHVETPAVGSIFTFGPAIGANGVAYFSVWANPALQVVGVK